MVWTYLKIGQNTGSLVPLELVHGEDLFLLPGPKSLQLLLLPQTLQVPPRKKILFRLFLFGFE